MSRSQSRSHVIEIARQSLIAHASKPASPMPASGCASRRDIGERISQMSEITTAYLVLMTALIVDLNDNVPVTSKISAQDFIDAFADGYADLRGAFQRVADEMLESVDAEDVRLAP
jgi:hypothetical protein